ncbi:methenyltetrahydrofolate synthase domain-containing protein isoform X4 [Chelonoidis abingdonii]|uniref:methenyltetrahydrofolate synthase domain-containing protein isoform X4 n=1 Tax=Chelonoidis abingdonii TaxID=106734 RepID=UPI003F4911D7
MEAGVRLSAGVSKWDIRTKIWDYMEANNLADFPRPVHHRIPNFKGSHQACHAVQELDIFNRTREVKVDPDKPLEGVRLVTLQARKTLLVPTPRLRTGLFNKIVPPPGATKEILRICATSQVVDIAEELLDDHDLTVDYILTPTRTIKTGCKRPKPRGIIWHKISYEILERIPILKNLRYREKQAGKDVILKDEHPDFPNARKPADSDENAKTGNTKLQTESASAQIGHRHVGNDSLSTKSETHGALTTVYVGNIPPGTRVSELKSALREFHASSLRLSWQGAQGRAFLDYTDKMTAESVVSSLKGLNLRGQTLRVEMAKNQRNKGQVEINGQRNKYE